MIEELAKKIASQLHTQCDDADSMEQVISAVLRAELSKAAGCELQTTAEIRQQAREAFAAVLPAYHTAIDLLDDIDLLLLQLAAAREREAKLSRIAEAATEVIATDANVTTMARAGGDIRASQDEAFRAVQKLREVIGGDDERE